MARFPRRAARQSKIELEKLLLSNELKLSLEKLEDDKLSVEELNMSPEEVKLSLEEHESVVLGHPYGAPFMSNPESVIGVPSVLNAGHRLRKKSHIFGS